jgi:hypothetical protein
MRCENCPHGHLATGLPQSCDSPRQDRVESSRHPRHAVKNLELEECRTQEEASHRKGKNTARH